MPTDPRKIAEMRKAERAATGLEFKQALALEQIADTLEALRIDLVIYLSMPSPTRESGLKR